MKKKWFNMNQRYMQTFIFAIGVMMGYYLHPVICHYGYGDYESLQAFNGNIAYGVRANGKIDIVDVGNEKVLVRGLLAMGNPFNEEPVSCTKGDGWGFFNPKTGEKFLDFVYEESSDFSEGLAAISVQGTLCFINLKGDKVLTTDYPYSHDMSNGFEKGFCVVRNNQLSKVGLIDRKGNLVLPIDYTEISYMPPFWLLRQSGKMAALDEDLNTVLPMGYYELYGKGDWIEAVLPNQQVRVYDANGALITDDGVLIESVSNGDE